MADDEDREQAKTFLQYLKENPDARKELEHAALEKIVQHAREKGYDFSEKTLLELPAEEYISATWSAP